MFVQPFVWCNREMSLYILSSPWFNTIRRYTLVVFGVSKWEVPRNTSCFPKNERILFQDLGPGSLIWRHPIRIKQSKTTLKTGQNGSLCFLLLMAQAVLLKQTKEPRDTDQSVFFHSHVRFTLFLPMSDSLEPRKKTSYFPFYWLVNRDPYNGLWNNPHLSGYSAILYIPETTRMLMK